MASYKTNLIQVNIVVTIQQYKRITQIHQSFTHAMKVQTHQ